MADQNVHVILQIEALPAHVDEVKAGLRQLAEKSRREAGCLSYAVLCDNGNPMQMDLIEVWRNADALAAHRASPHVAAAIGSMQSKIAGAPQVRELSPVG